MKSFAVSFLLISIFLGTMNSGVTECEAVPTVYSSDNCIVFEAKNKDSYAQYLTDKFIWEQGLFSLHRESQTVFMICADDVDSFACADETIFYCVDDVLFSNNYRGTKPTRYFEIEIEKPLLQYYDGGLFFVRNEVLYEIDLSTGVVPVVSIPGMTGLLNKFDSVFFFLYNDDEYELIMYNADTDEISIVGNEVYDGYPTTRSGMVYLTLDEFEPYVLADPNLLPIIVHYTIGDYYSTTGHACTCHQDHSHSVCTCIHYNCFGGSFYQCYGFACYAEDHYYHQNPRTRWCTREEPTDISSKDSLRDALRVLQPGTHVRFGSPNDSKTIIGKHSVIVLATSDTDITLLECNTNSDPCSINVTICTYEYIYNNRYRYIYFIDGHKINAQSTKSYLDNSFHKISCSKANCTGYKVELHTKAYQSTGDTYHIVICAECHTTFQTEEHSFDLFGRCTKCGHLR